MSIRGGKLYICAFYNTQKLALINTIMPFLRRFCLLSPNRNPQSSAVTSSFHLPVEILGQLLIHWNKKWLICLKTLYVGNQRACWTSVCTGTVTLYLSWTPNLQLSMNSQITLQYWPLLICLTRKPNQPVKTTMFSVQLISRLRFMICADSFPTCLFHKYWQLLRWTRGILETSNQLQCLDVHEASATAASMF